MSLCIFKSKWRSTIRAGGVALCKVKLCSLSVLFSSCISSMSGSYPNLSALNRKLYILLHLLIYICI